MDFIRERKDLLDKFEKRARMFIYHLQRYHHFRNIAQKSIYTETTSPYNNYDFFFIDDVFNIPLGKAPYFFKGDDGNEYIRYQFNRWVFIDFGNFKPGDRKVHVKLDKPVVLEEKTIGSDTSELDNNTDQPIQRTRSFEDNKVSIQEISQSLGIKASAAFTEKITAGGEAYGFKSETDITASIETSLQQASKTSNEIGSKDTGSWSGTIPPHTAFSLSRVYKSQRVKQSVHLHGDLDWTTRISSDRDFDMHWNSRKTLLSVINGVGERGVDDWADVYSDFTLEDAFPNSPKDIQLAKDICAPFAAEVTVDEEFDRATDAVWNWTSKKIK